MIKIYLEWNGKFCIVPYLWRVVISFCVMEVLQSSVFFRFFVLSYKYLVMEVRYIHLFVLSSLI